MAGAAPLLSGATLRLEVRIAGLDGPAVAEGVAEPATAPVRCVFDGTLDSRAGIEGPLERRIYVGDIGTKETELPFSASGESTPISRHSSEM